jgi:hypothetical protein
MRRGFDIFLTTRRLFVAILFLALFVMAAREISDPDFWWHLRTGQFIVETRAVPRADIFSHTNAGRPWVAHEWLSEVFIYALFALGSFPALILAFAGIITLAFAFVYARMGGKPYVAAFALLLAALATAPTWGVRPQMISLLLMSVFLWVLEKVFYPHPNPLIKRERELWLLVPLMILWVNLHSGYALGLALIAIYLIGEIIQRLTSRSPSPLLPRAPAPPLLRSLALVFLACVAVVPLNPNGATMYVYPLETLTSRAMQAYIQEWFSPDFHLVEFQPFAWLLLATLAAMGLSGKRITVTQVLLLVVFGFAALRSARNIPLFAIIAAPILAEHVWRIVEARWVSTNERMTRGLVPVNWLLLAMIVVAASARVAMVASNQNAVERAKFPAAAVDFLQAEKGRGNLYNAYGWGGYLIWRLYPETRVFIDGRADVYGDVFIDEFLGVYRASGDWAETLKRYNVGTVLIEPDAPLASQLARDAAWRGAYADEQAVVFLKR